MSVVRGRLQPPSDTGRSRAASSVFYSFHYERDVNRVQLVQNINALEGQPLLTPQAWESVRRRGTAAIAAWIDDQMKYKKAVIVLVGHETSSRDWVQYEIKKAWTDKRPLLGVAIHGLSSFGTARARARRPPGTARRHDVALAAQGCRVWRRA